MTETASYRLPRTVVPSRYELVLTPDLDAATFTGECRVDVEVAEPVTEIVVNAAELAIHRATIEDGNGRTLMASVALDEVEERAVLTLEGVASPGHWTLHTSFTGVLNDKLHGFYRSTFKDDAGALRTIATTQFEATDARRAFPCWDEPDFKAVFAITLVVDAQLTALSNGAVIAEAPEAGGKRRVTFAPTMPMSTYLVAFVVGPFELSAPVDVDGVPLRVATPPGKQHLTAFATEAGAHALRFLARYFEIPYPSDKIDHIAIPDFAFGAMENLGCVTYRETALLVDPSFSSRLELQRVADVVAHETAHMWFGDLVTMKWWNGIWLNEAFATFMELTTTNDWKPEWEVWTSFSAGRNAAMAIDGLTTTRPIEFPVGRPEEAEGMFDLLTYQKGGAVLRMLEQYLGPETFRKGIARYLSQHRYGNTETSDLWDAIEAVSGEPARATMDSWIYQGGHPLVTVEEGTDGRSVRLTQRRFLYAGGAEPGPGQWQVPINLRFSVGGEVRTDRLLLDSRQATVDLGGRAEWLVANAGASGFYRVRYSTELLGRLTSVMHEQLSALERLSLVGDTWAAVLSGQAGIEDYLGLLPLLAGETDPDVWAAAIDPFGLLDLLIDDAGRPRLQALVRAVVGPAFARLGWAPAAGEPQRTGTLRARLLSALGLLGADPAIRAEARQRLDRYFADPSSLAPDLVGPVVAITARAGGEAEYLAMLEQFRTARTPQDEIRYLTALGLTESEELLQRTLAMCLSDEVRTQDAPFLIGSMLASRAGGRRTWQWLTEHWDQAQARFPDTTIPRMLEGLTALVQPELAADVHSFLDAHPVPQGAQRIAQLRERLDVNVAFGRRVGSRLAELLSGADR